MKARPYWIEGPWRGRLGVAPRPRGGDWLEDELRAWQDAGVNTIVSLLEPAEESELELSNESAAARSQQLAFYSLPIPDCGVPPLDRSVQNLLGSLDSELDSGKNIVLHCRQGIGRSGLLAACLLIGKGFSSEEAVARVSIARGMLIPETPAQRSWIDSFAASLQRFH